MRGSIFSIGNAVCDPSQAWIRLLAKCAPKALLLNYARAAKRRGLKRPYFILSFDCDTDLDITVAEGVHLRLAAMGIQPVYAVPGQLLEEGIEVYRRIASTGAEFMNHGYYTHTYHQPETGTYKSNLFYDKLSRHDILDDIKRGHDAHLSLFGKAPVGFRVPHFGTFQASEHQAFVYDTLKKMGYRYSSSTVPLYSFLHGPLSKVRDTLYEIPLSGCYDSPFTILDSWSFRYAPDRAWDEEDYKEQFEKMVGFFRKTGRSGLLNYYVDPSQVYDWPVFFDCMELVSPMAVKSYEQLLEAVEK